MTRAVAIIQARMGSTRLPGKVMADLGGRPVLDWVVRSTKTIPGIDDVTVATSTAPADQEIVDWCSTAGVPCFRGSETDVLARYAGAAAAARADVIMRVTADCPLFDPWVGGQVLALLRRSGADYACNIEPASWPDGLDCEVVRADVLQAAHRDATRAPDREHVTLFIRHGLSRFRVENLNCPLPGLASLRWTLDTPADMDFIRAVVALLPSQRPPSHLEVLAVLEKEPQLLAINQSETRDEGLARSLRTEPVTTDRSYKQSQALLQRAERRIPLGSQTFSKSRIQYPVGAAPMFLTHGNGGRVWDVDGNEYVDLVSGLLPVVLGYRDPDVDAAIRRQLNRGISFSLATDLEIELAERLCRLIPCAEMVRFGKNGTDATSAAIRLARAATRRDRIALCGYHGWQDWYIGATTRNLGVPQAVSHLSHMLPFNDLEAAEALLNQHRGEFAALILEPTSVTEPKPGYLQGLKDLAHRHGALLIFDEVITGFRWSLGGAQAHFGVTPDLAAFGKAMGNGMPISAVLGRADLMALMEEIFFSGTFGGEALSLAAAIATVDKLQRHDVPRQLWRTGEKLKRETAALITRHGLQEQIALLGSAPWTILAFQNHPNAAKEAIKTLLLREMLAAGVLMNSSHNVTFAHDDNDLGRVLGAYDHALGVIANALASDTVLRRIGNQVIKPIFTVRTS